MLYGVADPVSLRMLVELTFVTCFGGKVNSYSVSLTLKMKYLVSCFLFLDTYEFTVLYTLVGLIVLWRQAGERYDLEPKQSLFRNHNSIGF